MKYIITESHVKSLIKVYHNLMNSEKYDGVCEIMVDYDEMFDKFVLNIFFNREYLINLNTGSKQTSYLRKMVDEIGNIFLLFTGKTPLIYQHYYNC